jgi:large subunit ribosomal protein L11
MSKVTKKVTAIVKLQVPAGKANPAPPVGTALGPKGVNIMDFCKQFNDRTKKMEPGTPIPVKMSVFADRSFVFDMGLPPNTYYIKKAIGLGKGHTKPGAGDPIGKITKSQINDIAKEKMQDMNANTVEAAASMIAGSARSMGLEVVEG